MKCLFHNHSTFSYDGIITIEEWHEFALQKKIDVIFLTEHTKDFNQLKMNEYLRQCGQYSDEKVLIYPGLEYGFNNNLHIVVLGLVKLIEIDKTKPIEFIQEVRRLGGITILTHPFSYTKGIPDNGVLASVFQQVDGIEIWNSIYDSRFCPSYKMVCFVNKMLQKRNGDIIAICGNDIHRKGRLKRHYLNRIKIVNGLRLERDIILTCIKEMNFSFGNGILSFRGKLKAMNFVIIILVRFLNIILGIWYRLIK